MATPAKSGKRWHNSYDTSNASTPPLSGGGTFVGVGELSTDPDVLVSCKSDVDGTLYVEFSTDGGTNYDTSIPFSVTGGSGEFHIIVKGYRTCRVRYVNGSVAQSYFRLHTEFGTFRQPNSALSSVTQQDADAAVVKAISDELLISGGLLSGYSIVNKFGTNADIDTGTVPEDIWEGGGAYTGFPSSGEALRAVSTSVNDANGGSGAEKISVAAMTTNYDWVTVTFTLAGTTPVAPDAPYATTQFIRAHTATTTQSANGANTAVNAGDISIYQAVTTSNIFLKMLAGRNQSNAAVYTVPAGYTARMVKLHSKIRGGATASLDGYIWTRSFGRPFRSRRPFSVGNGDPLNDSIYGGLTFTEKSDIVLRISSSSANNVSINGGFDLILVKN